MKKKAVIAALVGIAIAAGIAISIVHSSSVGIIGGADGPTSIFAAQKIN